MEKLIALLNSMPGSEARAAAAALANQRWQPMDTAPTEGRYLVQACGTVFLVQGASQRLSAVSWVSFVPCPYDPGSYPVPATSWHPLPEAV